MEPLAAIIPAGRASVMYLLGGAVGLLVAATLSGAVLGSRRPLSAGRRALAHWLPIAVTAVAFCFVGRFDMGLAIASGTSVALLAGICGFVIVSSPGDLTLSRRRSIWTLAPAASALLLVAGMRGYLGLTEAGTLLTEGLILGWLWVGAHHPRDPSSLAGQPVLLPAAKTAKLSGRDVAWGVAVMLFSAAAASMAALGAVALAARDPRYPAGLIAGTLLGLALVLPLISSGVHWAQHGEADEAVASHVGLMLLNICALVPLCIILHHVLTGIERWKQWVNWPADGPLDLILPRGVWRIDAVVLLVLGFVYLPAALGILRLGRRAGLGLVLVYCMYLALSAFSLGR